MKICVLGAGVIGLTSTWCLAEAGHDIVIVDRHDAPGAETSAANGGQLSYTFVAPMASPAMLHKLPGMVLGPGKSVRVSLDFELMRWGIGFLRACTSRAVKETTVAQLALAALSRTELEQLIVSQNLEFGLRTAGKLVLYRDAGDFAAAREAVAQTPEDDVEHRVLSPAECLAQELALKIKASELIGGIFTPSEQVADCVAFCAQLFMRMQQRNNVEIQMGASIKAPVMSGGRLRAVETDRGLIEADAFVLSLGNGSKVFARGCGFDFLSYPVKGHSITIPGGETGDSLRHSVTDYNEKTLFAPLQEPDGAAIRVAGFADFLGYDRTPDQSRIDALKTATAATLGIDGSRATAPWAGLRPMTPDSRPIIGRSPVEGLFLNTGHGMLGWTLACGSARLLTDIVDNKTPACRAEPFSVRRFS